MIAISWPILFQLAHRPEALPIAAGAGLLAAWPLPPILGAVEIGWSQVAGGLAAWLVTTGLTWLVASRVTTAVLTHQADQLGQQVGELGRAFDLLRSGLAEQSNQRVQCELRSARMYATREEFAQTLLETSKGQRDLLGRFDNLATSMRESVGKVHGRVDALADRLARMEGAAEQ